MHTACVSKLKRLDDGTHFPREREAEEVARVHRASLCNETFWEFSAAVAFGAQKYQSIYLSHNVEHKYGNINCVKL
jgi:hypothetical protein